MKNYFVCLVVVLVAPKLFSVEKKRQTPCRNIVEACKAAGYYKGKDSTPSNTTKGSLYPDCVDKIVKGEAIVGVLVDPSDVQACIAKKKQ